MASLLARPTTQRDLDGLVRCAPATDDLLQLSDWLCQHGAAHLRAIERIELAEYLITRRRFLVGVGAVVLAGCGAPEVAAPTATVATRRVTDSAGRSVQVPITPQRLVAGYTTDIDVALVLDLPLIAGPGARGLATQAFAPYQPTDQLGQVTRITTFPEANFEQIAAVDPDCIIDSVGDYIDGRIANLARIAPTFDYSAAYAAGWRDGVRAVGTAFDRAVQAEGFIADYERRVSRLRARLAERWPNATFALLSAPERGVVQIADRAMHPAMILADDLGITPIAAMPAEVSARPNLSLERLDLLADADVLFMRVEPVDAGSGRDRSLLDPILASPLWQRVPAVAQGQVVEYDAELFYASPLTATAFVAVVERALLA